MTNLPLVLIKFQIEWVDFYRESLDFQGMVGSHTYSLLIQSLIKERRSTCNTIEGRGPGLIDILWFLYPLFLLFAVKFIIY